MRIKRVLIVDTCLLGDFVHTIPALRNYLRDTGAVVDLLVSPMLRPLAERVRGINRIYTANTLFSKRGKDTVSKLPSEEYDLVIVMRVSREAGNIVKRLRFKKLKTYLVPLFRYALALGWGIFWKRKLVQWREFNSEFLVGHDSGKMLDFRKVFLIKESDNMKLKSISVFDRSGKKVVIHTGSNWLNIWSVDKWVELLKRLNDSGEYVFIFVGGSQKELEDFRKIEKGVDCRLYSFIKKCNVWETLLLMSRCDYFIGVDSGPRHIVHMLNIPSVNLLGPGPKIFFPLNDKAVIIDKSDCRCTNLMCVKRQTCLEKISVHDVERVFKSLVAGQ